MNRSGEKSLFAVFTRAIAYVPIHGFSCWAVTDAAMDAGYDVYGHHSAPRTEYESLMQPISVNGWSLAHHWAEAVDQAAKDVGWNENDYRQFMLSMAAESQR